MISVCIATYNGEKYIKEQVDSIIKQLGPNDEIIVSDDGSTDGTIGILQRYKDDRMKIYHHESSGANAFERVTNNFENALTHASGDYVFLSDQDDIWADDKVRLMVHELEGNLLVQCQLKPLGNVTADNSGWSIIPKKGLIPNLYKLPFFGCCMAMRKQMLAVVLPFPKGIIAHDAWIGMVGIATKRYSFVDKQCQLYRFHGDNTSGTTGSRNPLWRKLYFRFCIFKGIVSRYKSIEEISIV